MPSDRERVLLRRAELIAAARAAVWSDPPEPRRPPIPPHAPPDRPVEPVREVPMPPFEPEGPRPLQPFDPRPSVCLSPARAPERAPPKPEDPEKPA